MRSRWMVRISVAAAVTALCAAAVPAPAFAAGAPPAAPVLVSPASGATAPPGTPLTVQASDPDDASVEVVFHGAPRGTVQPPGVGDPFTFAVLPDTQNYVITPTNNPIMTAQAQWFVAQRDPLDIAFVAGVGDVVDNYTSDAQWTRASDNLAIMDAGGVPNSVLPGNHDFNLATGDFTTYNQYLPVSRYRDATWNSPAASYGGYYGQNQFGPDAADRQNMDNYALFTAGGMDFLLLNLELNPPDDVLAWAQRVLTAHPNRRAIVATHAYVNVSGAFSLQVQRTDVPGNSGAAIWQKLVQPHCNVFLVVNGHFTDLLDGEANRTDLNACGRPVHAALSDYQGRPNGGDGWLRYYTFTPAANEIRATTYSPTRNAYENDLDSSFVMSYDMSPPVDLPEIGRRTVASGAQASVPLPDLDPGTAFDWYATVGDGTNTTRGPAWSVTVSAPPPAGALAQDAFGRTVAAGWGTADTGGPWTVNSTTKLSVASGVGRVAANAGSTLNATLGQVSSSAIDLTTTLAIDKVPNQLLNATLAARVVGTSLYGARLRINPNGSVQLHLMRDATALSGITVPGITATAGTPIRVRVQVDGTNPTTLRARAWPAAATEPTTWQTTATDTTAALQNPGSPRLSTYLSSSATNGPVTVTYDDLTATTIGGGPPPPPPNVPPTAAFTWSANGLTASADSTTSSDPDGTIVSRSWDFAGVSGGSGITASRTFPTAGTYPVTLTVTDDDGATATTTQSVTVSAPPPAGALAQDAFGRTVAAGWGTADTGGPWTVNSTTKLSVASGVGRVAANAGSTLNATLGQVSSSAIDLTTTLAIDKVPNQLLNATLAARVVGTSLYGARLRINPNGSVQLHLMRDATALSGITVPGITATAGTPIRVRVQVDGTNPTTLRARAWPAAATEPTTWQTTATDTTAALQNPGSPRLSTYLSSSATNGPVTVTYDDLTATTIGGGPPPPPPNVPPTAAFTWSANGLTASADSTTSSDPDGTIVSRSWDFAGVSGGSGITASRTFPTAGTYPVTLTVTDDDGATATTTQSVTVSAPPPAGALAQDAFGRTVAAGWGTADTGGPWTVNSTTKLSVASGVGRVAANAGSTLNATLGQVSSSAIDLTTTLAIDKVPNQLLNATLAARVVGTSLYGARLRINPNGSVQLHLMRDATALSGITVPGITATAGTPIRVRVQVDGTNPTTLRARAWPAAATEPTTWQTTATDTTAALQNPGSPRLSTYLSSSATNGPVTVTYDDLTATSLP